MPCLDGAFIDGSGIPHGPAGISHGMRSELFTYSHLGCCSHTDVLVQIYLRQLPSLSLPVPSTLSRPSPSSLSISSLGLPRSFPSSRSFTQSSPVGSAGLGPPTPDSGQQDKDAGKDKEQTKSDRVQRPTPARRPILSEKEMGDITRNAEQLVKFHENFIQELKSAVEPLGYGSAFIRSPLAVSPVPNFNGDMKCALENVEGAIRLVADAFTQQVSSVVFFFPSRGRYMRRYLGADLGAFLFFFFLIGGFVPTLRGVLFRSQRGC